MSYFEAFKAPPELIAIAFLESSFNPRAVSRAGATGAWQFLRRSCKSFMKLNNYVDHRLNPLLATFGAIYLLKQNKQILRNWDLAITAYNAGPGHFIKGRRKLRMRAPSLELLLEKYEHPNIGFAVKNYYSEFLALVYTLAYKTEIFKNNLKETRSTLNVSQDHIAIYVARKRFRPKNLFNRHKKISPDLRHLNRHIKKYRTLYPKGTIFFSDVELESRNFRKLKLKQLLNRYPKNWHKLAR
jgi:membrane-bound lytic murein transglycosylase D